MPQKIGILLASFLIVLAARVLAAPLPELDNVWDFDHPDKTEKAFRDLLPQVVEAKDAAYLAELNTQIARTQGLQRHFPEAQATLDAVEKALPPGPSRARVRLELERGRVFNSSGKVPDARPHFLAAWDAAGKLGEDALAIDAAHMMGIIEKGDAAMDWNRKALAAAEASKNVRARRWKGSLYNNIGWTYHDELKDYAKALEMFEKALAAREEQHAKNEVLIARWAVARAHRSLGHLDRALEMQQALAAEHVKAGTGDPYVHEELGELLLALKRDAEATPEFAKAYAELVKDPSMLEGERPRLERMRTLAGVKEPLPAAK